ncbi:MAG TPA: antitoxin Xre-like helix-turn-helix domain-containing protein [Spongiibacteraceae bacterium]|nr:antitoxin Xre-like helix-turn-helix domain-containing protein [Spongiibacteraceae bacterium]
MPKTLAKADATAPLDHSDDDVRIGLKAALNILNKWRCSEAEKQALLGIKRSTLHKYQDDPNSARVTNDLAERVSYLLNIHHALRLLFSNPENVYGFVRLDNQSPPFNGMTPMQFMQSGRCAALYEVFRHVDGLRGGQW